MTKDLSATVFVPNDIEEYEHHHLYGSTLIKTSKKHDSEEVIIVVSSHINSINRTEKIGCFKHCSCERTSNEVHLYITSSSAPTNVEITKLSVNNVEINCSDINVIFYNPCDIGYSELLNKKFNYDSKQDEFSVSYMVHKVKQNFHYRKNMIDYVVIPIFLSILSFTITVLKPLCYFMKNLQNVLSKRLNYTSKSLEQVLLRMSQLEEAKSLLQNNAKLLLFGRIISVIICDITLGVALMMFIYNHSTVEDVYNNFRIVTKIIITNVQQLLHSLSGAPAGLKLNQPLTQALAGFFQYHVYLWNLYLELAQPVVKGLALVFIWIGTAGISVQISILSDLVDLATLHLYCFYVYAARIHMVQISLLGSQWRAFCGKKWNPLKTRIDTYEAPSYTSLSRVLMAVMFTLVVFLLPTTTVYYGVFMLLRVVVFSIRGVFSYLVWMLNYNPVYIVFLQMINSPKTRGDIYFEVVKYPHDQNSEALYLKMLSWKMPFFEILHFTSSHVFSKKPNPNWSFLFNSILYAKDLL